MTVYVKPAYQQGHEAFGTCVKINPFPVQSIKAAMWYEGWKRREHWESILLERAFWAQF